MRLEICQHIHQLIALMEFVLLLCKVLIREYKKCFKFHILSRCKLK